ncbi:Uncharacterised protein [Mycobacteroides abscessus subsp. abscessus]|nr:Uncharacterised protein [Mycobacteroides abscessus subsp. abscessus]
MLQPCANCSSSGAPLTCRTYGPAIPARESVQITCAARNCRVR